MFNSQSKSNRNSFGSNKKIFDFKTEGIDKPNFMNPAFNVKLPIFSIHGNHDDPVGLEMMSTLDQAASNNYLNYFGKVENIENFEVRPILFTKEK